MENSLFTSNSTLLIKRLRKRKISTKTHLLLDKSKFDNNLEKSFNFKENHTTKNIFPSLSLKKVKYFTKSNSRASSTKEEVNTEKEKSMLKTNIYNKTKITLKMPQKIDNLKNMRNRIINRGNNYYKTENNQRIIFNNIGINYHKMKSNKNNFKRSLEKRDINSIKEMDKTNDNIKVLLIKNNKPKFDKSEKDDRIEKLEQKIDKLIDFINNNETLNLKNKINSLEKDIEILKKENQQLKNELEAKNEIISSLSKNKKPIVNNKETINDYMKTNIEINKKIKYKSSDIDMDKLKQISIDPDDI